MKTIDQLTKEDLRLLPLNKLRNLDIRTTEQEKMVQSIIDEKMMTMPAGNPLVFSHATTDAIKTPEDEALLQAKIDAHNAAAHARLSAEIGQLEVLDSPAEDDEEKEDEPSEEILVETKKVFCQHCDSKGGAHKKMCTRSKVVA